MTDSFELGGGGGNAFSFGPQGSQPGASITGTVLDMKEVQKTNFDTKKLEFWDNGDPKMQFRVTLQTQLREDANDDGKRDLYLDGRKRPHDNGAKSRICAVLDAVRAATGGTALQRGATLTVTWTSGMGFSGDPRGYTAEYVPPALNLDSGQPTQAPAAQAPAAQQNPWAQPTQATAPQPAATPAAVQTPTPQPTTATTTAQGPTPEQVAAVRAAGLDPSQVFAGQQLPAGV